MPRWNNRGPYDGGYQNYRDRPPQGGPPPRQYPDDDYDDYEDQGGGQVPPYYTGPWGAPPQRPPRSGGGWDNQRPRGRRPQQGQWGDRPPQRPPYQDNRPRGGSRGRPPQRQWDDRPPRGPQGYDDRPSRQVPPEGFNPGTFSFELGDLVKHKTTGLEMTVIRFGREQVECRIHADMSPNWFYESELVFICHEGETPPDPNDPNDSDPQ